MDTIVVVDDDEDLRSLLVMRLRSVGYDVHQSGDGLAGLELIRACRPALVVVDWMMPGRTGVEVCEELRNDPECAEIPILMVTSRTATSDLAHALRAGATSVLPKPFSLANLLEVVRGLVDDRRTAEPDSA